MLEVASPSAGRRDYLEKREIYAGLGVGEYWRFDSGGGRYHDAALAGDRLENDAYRPIPVELGADGVLRGHSGALGLGLHWRNRNLQFRNPATRDYLPDIIELLYARNEAEARATSAERRVRELEAELNRRNPPT